MKKDLLTVKKLAAELCMSPKSTFEHMSGSPLLGITRDGDHGPKVIETEGGPHCTMSRTYP